MASSEKPDFIETAQKGPTVKLTTDGSSSSLVSEDELPPVSASVSVSQQNSRQNSQQAAPSSVSPANETSASNFPPENNDVIALRRREKGGKKLPILPGGGRTVMLLICICMFGLRIDEMRNSTLTNIATTLFADRAGYVETISDLGNSYQQHHKFDEARKVYENALGSLSLRGLDKGSQGAYLRLKLANLAFDKKDKDGARRIANEALDMLATEDAKMPYDMPFELHELATRFDDWWDYKTGMKLNQKSLEFWPHTRFNYRSFVLADLGLEYSRTKQYDKAEDSYSQSIRQSMRLGAYDFNVWRYIQLAQVQITLRKFSEAELNLSSARKMLSDLKRGNVEFYQSLIATEQGRLAVAQGNMNEAQTYFEKAAALLKDDTYHRYYYLVNQLQMANFFRDTQKFDKAKELYEDLVSRLYDRQPGPAWEDVKHDFGMLKSMMGGR